MDAGRWCGDACWLLLRLACDLPTKGEAVGDVCVCSVAHMVRGKFGE